MNLTGETRTIKQCMMKPYISLRNIKVKIEMTPEQINKNWRVSLFLNICQKFKGKCTKDDGYIFNIKKIIRIYDQCIKRSSGVVLFFVEISAECIVPKIGESLDAIVDMIFPHGVFCHHNMLRMMMPIAKCKNFHIRQEFSTNSLYDPLTKTLVRKGDIIRVLIDDIRYENDLYSCIVSISA